MDQYRAIPPGYMTVGQLAKKMNTTVRTLQYYDRQGLFSPSAESEGGRRLYTDKDVVLFHQIQSLKYLGFSLDDIKNRLVALETPVDVAQALSEHAAVIREKVAGLSQALEAIEALGKEVLAMDRVDFRKYADIIVNLQMKNEFYGLIKHMDDATLDFLRGHYNKDSGQAMMDKYKRLIRQAVQLRQDGATPESEQGQVFAKAFWDMIMEFTGGDRAMLSKMIGFAENMGSQDNAWQQAKTFIEPALGAYFGKLGINPLEQEEII